MCTITSRSGTTGERSPEWLKVGLIRKDSFDSAQSTGAAAHINYEIATLVGHIHILQRDLRTIFQSYINTFFVKAGNSEACMKIWMRSRFGGLSKFKRCGFNDITDMELCYWMGMVERLRLRFHVLQFKMICDIFKYQSAID